VDQLAKNFDLVAHFDRVTGGLKVVGSTIEDGYDIDVDGHFAGTHAPQASLVNPSTVNRISDSGLALPELHWIVTGADGQQPLRKNIAPDWTLTGANTAFVESRADRTETPRTIVFNCPVEGTVITVAEGLDYDFQALFALHRTDGRVRLLFLDRTGGELQSFERAIPEGFLGGRNLADYASLHLIATAPKGSTGLRIEIIKGLTATGTDSFLFFTRPAEYDGLESNLPPALAADIFRSLTPNNCVGSLPIPGEALDGGFHRVTLTSRSTGAVSRGVPVALPDSMRCTGIVHGLDGSTLVARMVMPPNWKNRSTVSLWVDGRPVDKLYYTSPETGEVRCPLPAQYCDGRPHLFELRLGISGQLLCQLAATGPVALTPWKALQRYAGMPLPSQMSALAPHRYLSLTGAPAAVAEGAPSLQELHDILVEGFAKPRQQFRPLPFPYVEQPDVSVIIPVHNKFDMTYVCLAALLFAINKASFEVIIVDDGSTDTTRLLEAVAPGVTVVRHETAQGFVGSCNDGAAVARGRHIVLLNNDTEPTAHWLDEMLFVFENFDGVGLVGAKLIYPDGSLQEAGGIVWETGDPWNYGSKGNPFDPRYNYTRMCDYLSGAALMMPADLWRETGGLSGEFAPAYFEDTDLAFKVRAAGKKVAYAPRALVVHYEGQSNGIELTAGEGLKRFQELNRPKFKRKWQAHFAANGKVGIAPDLAKDRGISKRVVFFDCEFPRPDGDAGSYAAIQEIRMFQALGCKVTFVPLNMEYLGRHTEDLQRIGVETIHTPFYPDVAAFLRERGTEFDLAYITRYGVAERLIDLLRQHAEQARIVLNVADLHFLRQIREGMAERSEEKLLAAIETRKAEIETISQVELVLSYSAVEQAVISSHVVGGPQTGIIPWVVDTASSVTPFSQRGDLAFIGGFRHPPNAAGVKYFAEEVMPLLRKALPGVRFLVYGSQVTPEVEALARDDVVIKGYVSDLAEVFGSCRLFVSPLLSGAGLKGKVLDSMAAGVPAVMSSLSAEGIGLRHGLDTIIADRPEDWVAGIVRLYNDEETWTAMSQRVMDLARSHYSFEMGVAGLREALAAIDFFAGSAPALVVNSTRPASPTARRPAAAERHPIAALKALN
jgi:GT2 family glycosyltransferase/glycosyltransferase involved in cell wall biosynthesis